MGAIPYHVGTNQARRAGTWGSISGGAPEGWADNLSLG
ncbi:hypothetical protein E2C01_088020 [Portunus trituberculatus]|uniref:Uncharacterized protein n=1 Tax=Portunus trituberculatus TaxID=210409 RepID=A0A5B7JI21_PORTR|nr:hypothetical protein [Portunus trituberculatus]